AAPPPHSSSPKASDLRLCNDIGFRVVYFPIVFMC
ncbi:unnamed protein product, partial [Brassica oleracea]